MSVPAGWESLDGEAKRELLERLLRERAAPALPLSFGQKALWFLYQMAPESAAYNVAFSALVHSPLDPAALARAFAALSRRHEPLRASFEATGHDPVQRIHESVPVHVEQVDARAWDDAELARRLKQSGQLPFDLARGPLFRIALFQRPDGKAVLLLVVHHIVFDAFSLGVLLREWMALYAEETWGVAAALPPLPARYSDYVAWHERLLASDAGEASWEYWRQQLAEPLPVVELPLDHPRPPRQSFRGATHAFRIDSALTGALRELARRQGTTLFTVLLACFQALLHRYTGQRDLLLGSPTAGRSRSEFEGLIGYFVNPVVLRARIVDDPSFVAHLDAARRNVLDALKHADYPFPLLVQRLKPERDASRTPLFQIDFNLVKTGQVGVGASAYADAEARFSVSGVEMTIVPIEQQEGQFDLALEMFDTGDSLLGHLKYATDLFEEPTVARIGRHLQRLFEGVAAAPEARLSELPLLTAEEEAEQELWNDTGRACPRAGVHELIVEQARRTPGRIAGECGGVQVTYRELDERSGRLAAQLRGLGVGPDVLVGLFLERSLDMLVGLLAVLRAGGAYLPLDPAFPPQRLGYMMEDSGARVLLTQRSLRETLPAAAASVVCVDDEWSGEAGAPAAATDPETLAYVIYTSGSTGKPKGVGLTHRSLVNLLLSMAREPGLTQADLLLSVTTLSFDIATLEMCLPLLVGARVAIVERSVAADGEALRDRLASSGATVMQATPATWRLLLASGWEGTPGLKILCGGEALPRELANQMLRRAGEVWNVYGPTETTIYSSGCRVSGTDGPVPIGRPIANTSLYVLDPRLNRLPVGVAGELFIGGEGLARGYLNRPELTAEKFLPDPYSRKPGARMYRTGDLARWLPDGSVECLGRVDHQVKIRGFRIELGEIEAAIVAHPSVRQAVVVAREDSPGDKRLAAYFVTHGEEAADIDVLRRTLRERLPEYMVPAHFMPLEALPLTPNGKVDRKRLPAPERPAADAARYVAPRTSTEEILAGIWTEVLGVGPVGAHDHFFELGGHSLLATQVVSRVRQAFGIELPLRELFDAPSVARLAPRVEALRAAVHPVPAAPALHAEPRGGPAELSYAQQRLWFLDQLEPGSPAYVIAGALEITGPLDVAALENALNAIVARHESLRTTFESVEGRPLQIVSPPGPCALALEDLSGEAAPLEGAGLRMREEARRGFDLTRGPLFRPVLYRLGPERHLFLLSMHHIISDGWSIGVMFRELGLLYDALRRGAEPALPELPLQYADFAAWQRRWLQGEALAAELEHARARLAGAPHVLELPCDRPRPAVESHRGASSSFLLPRTTLESLQALSRREGTTLFGTLLAAFAALLWRYTGQDELLIGSPVANRNRAEIEGLVGCFVNTLVLRANLAGDPTLQELIARVREESLSAFDHQDVPFERLVEELRPERDLGRNPLFQVMLVLQNAPLQPLRLGELRLNPLDVDRGASQLDLTLYAQETSEGLRGVFEYASDLFDEGSIQRMARHLRRLLEGMLASPDARVSTLPLLTDEEQDDLMRWNATQRPYPPAGVHELIVAQARRAPDRLAARCGGQRLTYRELDERSGRLAAHLRSLGVAADVPVGVYMERSLDMLVGLLGVLRAGGAYVPLDPAFPRDRLAYMVEDSDARVLLSQRALLDSLPATGRQVVCVDGEWSGAAAGPDAPASPETLAYVIYTSGSTGKPKGVAVTHRSLVNLLVSMAQEPGLAADDILLSVTTLSFDIAGLELYLPLLVGAQVVLVERDEAADGRALQERLAASGATVLQATPATWRLLLESGWAGTPGLKVLCGGEALPPDLAVELATRAGELWNVYGPTETTIWSSAWRVAGGDGPVPIGRPIANTSLHVLDRSLNLLPVGVPGELFIGGDGLARGYWRRPQLTAEKFVPDPFSRQPGARMYRTGDLARRLPDGSVECLGRLDHQVKVRGFRIELGEIEAALRQYPGIDGAVVLALEVAGGDRRLVAYLAHGPQLQPNVTALRTHLKSLLPLYMVPSSFVFLDRLPLTPNGKLDRKALAQLEAGQAAGPRSVVPPRTDTEAFIAQLWREALGVERVGVRDNFFDLGGHSLLAMRVLAAIEKKTGHHFHPRDIIFQNLEQLAAACEAAPPAPPASQAAGLTQRLLGALRELVGGSRTPDTGA